MNIHELTDKLLIEKARLAGKKKRYFREEIESASIKEHIKATHIEIQDIDLKGENMIEAITAQGPVNCFFKICYWKGYDYPTLLFNHYRGDRPYYKRLESLFPTGNMNYEFNMIATGAPFNFNREEYVKAMGRLRGYVRKLAVTAVLNERILQYLKKKGSGRIVISGTSFGGWVSNVHKAYFNSADEYRPVLAGTKPDEMFLNSYFSRMVAECVRLLDKKVMNALDFDLDFRNSDNQNVFPLLARYDQFVKYEKQKDCYKPENITLVEKGHYTTLQNKQLIREHILKAF